jgi:hypothetical protein
MADVNKPQLPETTQALIDSFSRKPILDKGERVVTFGMADRLHGTESVARQNFDKHKDQFAEGRDFFRVPYGERSRWGGECNQQLPSAGGYRGKKIALTESGYVPPIKAMKDDLSWAIYKVVLGAYFLHKALEAGTRTPSASAFSRAGRQPPAAAGPPCAVAGGDCLCDK